jgi:site-specific recombinase XerD
MCNDGAIAVPDIEEMNPEHCFTPLDVHMIRHSTGYALANRGMDTRRLQHFLGHASITNTVRYTAMSPEPFKDIWR